MTMKLERSSGRRIYKVSRVYDTLTTGLSNLCAVMNADADALPVLISELESGMQAIEGFQ